MEGLAECPSCAEEADPKGADVDIECLGGLLGRELFVADEPQHFPVAFGKPGHGVLDLDALAGSVDLFFDASDGVFAQNVPSAGDAADDHW